MTTCRTAIVTDIAGRNGPPVVTFTDADVTEENRCGLIVRIAHVVKPHPRYRTMDQRYWFVQCPHGTWVQCREHGRPTTIHHSRKLECSTCQAQRTEAREQEARVGAMLKAMPRASRRRKVAA